MPLLKKDIFYFNFYERQVIPNYFGELFLGKEKIYQRSAIDAKPGNQGYLLTLFPSYLNLEIYNKTGYYHKKINENKIIGNAIVLNEFESINDFMTRHLKSKYRKNTRRFINRLESCFNISYRMFFGEISESDYNDLMEILKEMIVSRFKEIDESHFALPQWENTKESCRTLIHEKKCSMLVIYHDDKPIDITLSYHFNGIFYSGISSFDIDYSKFGLGHISIYKELEWALDNDYKFFDLTYGGNTYKKLWSNCDYLFENHIFGKKKSISGLLVFTVSILYVQLKKLLKKLNVHLLYLYLKNSLSPKKNQKNKSLSPKMEYSVEHFSCPIDPALKLDFENIDISSKTSGIVLRPIYDFLYVNQEKYNNITLAKQNLQNNSFYILGEKKWAKVSTNNEKI